MVFKLLRESQDGPLAVVVDLGTSGFRAQAVDAASGQTLATAITTRHPLPGANVMDHLHFALELGVEAAQRIVITALNRLIRELAVPAGRVARLAVCGNPAQLSIFQGIEIRDLAFAGARILQSLGVTPPLRDAARLCARDIPGLELPGACQVLIPPAVRHEIGADALALILKSGLLGRDETALAVDYGTNAEIALLHNGRILTGSTAAGPAIEGQHITCGMLAAPGAISDLIPTSTGHRLLVLDDEMRPAPGDVVDLRQPGLLERGGGPRPRGVAGTGTLAAIEQALAAGVIALPGIHTPDERIHLGEDFFLTAGDVAEAGKAVGAIRAGMIALCHEAGIGLEAIHTAYMAGASGTYVDALKARQLGLVPPCAKTVFQVGNTSLAMARDLALDPRQLDVMSDLARRLRQTHCMFANSKAFARAYILELSFWTEGMPMDQYRQFLRKYGLPDLPPLAQTPEVHRAVERDIPEPGSRGIQIVPDIGETARVDIEGCIACGICVEECPEQALLLTKEVDRATMALDQARCDGVACRRCERVCPVRVFVLNRFFEPGPVRKPETVGQ